MGLYDGIKDVAKVVQQADNIDLYKQLVDLSAQALEQQSEIIALKEEIKALKETKDIEEKILRHEEAYITLIDDSENQIYCSTCWDTKKQLVQGQKTSDGRYYCGSCQQTHTYDAKLFKSSFATFNNNHSSRRSGL